MAHQQGRDQGNQDVPERVSLDRRYDAGADTHYRLYHDGHERQLHRVRVLLQDDARDRRTALVRGAEVTLEADRSDSWT